MFCEEAAALLREMKRAPPGGLPPFGEERIDRVIMETNTLCGIVRDIIRQNPGQPPINVAASLLIHHSAVMRNKRCLQAYISERTQRLKALRWETGSAVLPEDVTANLSPHEVASDLYAAYGRLVLQYQRDIDIELTSDMQPPKELFITVRCLEDIGELVTDSGPLHLALGAQHFVRRSDVEALIRQGKLEHIV